MRTQLRLYLIFLLLLLWPSRSHAALDIYGGDASHPCVGVLKNGSAIPGITGYFYLYKDSNLKRWMFCDPLGNSFWDVGVQLIDEASYTNVGAVNTKYGGSGYYASQVQRLKALGFNTVGEYANVAMYPSSVQAGSNPNPMPFESGYISPSHYSLGGSVGVKSMTPLLPPAYDTFSGYRAADWTDYFDPAWVTYVGQLFVAGHELGNTAATWNPSPWVIGVTMDDGDYLWGLRLHGGWMTGVYAPYASFMDIPGHGGNTLFADPIVYTKQQLQTNLTAQYGTVGALNAAWGSSYTTLGSAATTVASETIGTGTGAQTTFNYTFAHLYVDPASILIKVGGVAQAGDCPWFEANCNRLTASSNGTIIPVSGNILSASSQVNYSTGAITLVFSSAPGNGVAITASYQYGGWPKVLGTSFIYTPGATDPFTRPNGGLGANWTTIPGFQAPQILTNVAAGSSIGNENAAVYSAYTPPSDQYNKCTLGGVGNFGVLCLIRASSSAATFYGCKASVNDGGDLIQVEIAGTASFHAFVSHSINTGDVITCQVKGSIISLYHNNVLQSQWTDTQISSGSCGFDIINPTVLANDTLTAFECGPFPSASQSGGSGLLDEDGTSSWWPSSVPSSGGTQIQKDLETFWGQIAKQYFSTYTAVLRSNLPNHLIGGSLGTFNAPTIESQEALYVDFIAAAAGYPSQNGNTGQAIGTAAYNLMGIPFVMYNAIVSTSDSQYTWANCAASGWGDRCATTQTGRGAFYLNELQQIWNYKGADGYGFMVGSDFWQYTDNNGETQNFGLVSSATDNLYGYIPGFPSKLEDQAASITDPFGFTTIPETATHGNFVNAGVVCGNQIWLGVACNSPAAPGVSVGHLP